MYLIVSAPMTAAGKNAMIRLRVNRTSLRSLRNVPENSWNRRWRNTHMTAMTERNWMTTSKNLSLPEDDRKSVVEGKSGTVRVALGGCRITKKKINNIKN